MCTTRARTPVNFMAYPQSEFTAAALRSSDEKTQYAKLCRLIIDGGRLALKQVFDSFHPPANLQTSLGSHSATLQDLRKRRKLKDDQWNLLFPPGGAKPDSEQFDITLLFLLLRSTCGLSPPVSGWDSKPPQSDVSREADLVRIKWFRNQLAHRPKAEIDEPTFEAYWSELSDALGRLGLDSWEMRRLKCFPVDEKHYMNVRQDEILKPQVSDMG